MVTLKLKQLQKLVITWHYRSNKCTFYFYCL